MSLKGQSQILKWHSRPCIVCPLATARPHCYHSPTIHFTVVTLAFLECLCFYLGLCSCSLHWFPQLLMMPVTLTSFRALIKCHLLKSFPWLWVLILLSSIFLSNPFLLFIFLFSAYHHLTHLFIAFLLPLNCKPMQVGVFIWFSQCFIPST